MEKPTMDHVNRSLVELHNLRQEEAKLYGKIFVIESKLARTKAEVKENFPLAFWDKYKVLHEQAKHLAEKEAELCDEINEMIAHAKMDEKSETVHEDPMPRLVVSSPEAEADFKVCGGNKALGASVSVVANVGSQEEKSKSVRSCASARDQEYQKKNESRALVQSEADLWHENGAFGIIANMDEKKSKTDGVHGSARDVDQEHKNGNKHESCVCGGCSPSNSVSRFRPPSPRSLISVGDEVAANVSKEGEATDVWIIARVIAILEGGTKFHVLDEIPDEVGASLKEFVLQKCHIIPFPKKRKASQRDLICPVKDVLAVYPDSTTLYKATVVGHHHDLLDKVWDYILEFDDDQSSEGEGVVHDKQRNVPCWRVPFHLVVPLPEGHRQ